ncbi:hypothetical protein DNTS_032584 [Danionella cerebrum]|uniref:Transmembrane channel-like protein n=1 Tax=Danionella cerebrum TaxID=2873325 RepID=A0A553PYA6_9TELE|nr:hypothetical protein DNTS_032584 [Danionella translucida]
MTSKVSFHSELTSDIESPVDEDLVHDSFSQLIQEQGHDLYDVIEMTPYEPQDNDDDEVVCLERYHTDDDALATDNLIGGCWSSDTLKVLSGMPSRTIGRSRGAIISQYYNRTMQLRRRRQSQPSVHTHSHTHSARPSIRGYRVETDGEEENKRERLVVNLQNLSANDRARMLRAMPLGLREKQELRMLVLNQSEHSPSQSQIPCCSQIKYHLLTVSPHETSLMCGSLLSSLKLWQTSLKCVSGRFGTGVLSYFLFLRTLLFLNVFLFLFTAVFLVAPQAAAPPDQSRNSNGSRRSSWGLEVLTGAGYFSDSLLYYGHYSQQTLGVCANSTGMSKSFSQSLRIHKSRGLLAIKAFSSWDHKVSKKSSVRLQRENIGTQLKELVSEVSRQEQKVPVLQRLFRIFIHSLAWIMCLGSSVACVLAVYYCSEYMHKDLRSRARSSSSSPLLKELSFLSLPLLVSTINLLLPGFFNALAWMEEFDSPSTLTYVSISRNLLLKVCVLGVLCYHWLGRVASDPQSLGLECWESFVGQELYRFLLMDFIFILFHTFIGEFLWRALKRKRKPVFDIARNVLELIYGQTLAWLGVMFSPLLPVVQIIKLLLLFYMKKMNCQASGKPWRASQMSSVFITLLCFPSFLGSAVCVTYTMWTIPPSTGCGPFRGLSTMFESGKLWVRQVVQLNPHLWWLEAAHTYLVENPLFLFLCAAIFLIVIYFHSQVMDGQRKIIDLLQEQIQNEGEDKKFLIMRLQEIHEKRRVRGARQGSSFS